MINKKSFALKKLVIQFIFDLKNNFKVDKKWRQLWEKLILVRYSLNLYFYMQFTTATCLFKLRGQQQYQSFPVWALCTRQMDVWDKKTGCVYIKFPPLPPPLHFPSSSSPSPSSSHSFSLANTPMI